VSVVIIFVVLLVLCVVIFVVVLVVVRRRGRFTPSNNMHINNPIYEHGVITNANFMEASAEDPVYEEMAPYTHP
jgi:heme/copper-type cytochrome/quinol oxidase subunit 2